jgi:hypothetical protein
MDVDVEPMIQIYGIVIVIIIRVHFAFIVSTHCLHISLMLLPSFGVVPIDALVIAKSKSITLPVVM